MAADHSGGRGGDLMGRELAPILAMAVAACNQAGPASRPNLRTERVAQLQKIASTCGLPGTLELVGTEDVRFRPSPSSKYERVDCVLKALKKTDIPMKMGFVGNEAYETGNRN
jgi:hypothetical protein